MNFSLLVVGATIIGGVLYFFAGKKFMRLVTSDDDYEVDGDQRAKIRHEGGL